MKLTGNFPLAMTVTTVTTIVKTKVGPARVMTNVAATNA
jgi:hypothetical protein